MFASETHGYDTVDHFRIDPRLGDDDDFDALVAAAHDRGLRVLLDGVFNHVGRGLPGVRAVLAEAGRRRTAAWFRLLARRRRDGWLRDVRGARRARRARTTTSPPVVDYVAA